MLSSLRSTLIAAAIIAALSIAVYVQQLRVNAARAERDTALVQMAELAAQNESYSKALAASESEMRLRDAAILARDEALKTITARRETMRRVITEAVQHDKTVRDWHNTPLPAAVLGVLGE